jgi:hypothetical protein
MNKPIKIYILLFFFICIVNSYCFALTHTVSGDCSASAVQIAINNATEGDIIDVTCTGTVNWSTPIKLNGGKTLIGGGKKGANGTDGTWPLTINVTLTGSNALIEIINTDNSEINRVSGFKFEGTGAPTWIIKVIGKGTGKDGKGTFRIDNNYFNAVAYGSRLTFTDGSAGKMTGVFDNNVFYYLKTSTPRNYGNNSYQNTYKGISSTCYGYDSLHRSIGFGSDDFVFWEKNYMHNAFLETSDGGGRVVFRYNEIKSDYTDNSMLVLDGHGADTAGHNCAGIVANEFYNNTITGLKAFAQIVDMRGGKWMVHNNNFQSGYLQINEYRVSGPQYLDWNTCSGTSCCEQACKQNPTINDFSVCYPLPNQVRNTYLWNNIKSNMNMSPAAPSGSEAVVNKYIAINRDYWMPSYGLEEDLPSTCTTGNYYGATDSGKLWKCNNNVWEEYYTPFTYPHPLRKPKAPEIFMN